MEPNMDIKELAVALNKTQAELQGAIADKVNPHFRSKYASLDSVIKAVKDAAIPNGLSFVQVCHECENGVAIETIIIHESGQIIRCGKLNVPAMKNDPQSFGSAMSYARRYSLSAAFGVAVDEDDDGNSATEKQKSAPATAPKKETVEETVIGSAAIYASVEDLLQLFAEAKDMAEVDKLRDVVNSDVASKTLMLSKTDGNRVTLAISKARSRINTGGE